MKYLLLVFTLISCGLSKTDKEDLSFKIRMHNNRLNLKYSIDSVQEATRLRIENIRIKDTHAVNSLIIATMPVFEKEWNNPYDIKKDRFLTLESYLDYCNANNYKPKDYIKYID